MEVDKLVQILEEQIKVYRHLLEVVRKEKEILISANLDDLNENNRTKEAMLLKIRALETERIAITERVCVNMKLTEGAPRLLEIARNLDGEVSEKLRNIHSVLDLLLRRVQDLNQGNEQLVQSALKNITGAMNAIRGTLQEKQTYQRKGEVAQGPVAGQLVSKEA